MGRMTLPVGTETEAPMLTSLTCLVPFLITLVPQPAQPDLKKLAGIATRHRIPMPPKDAPLVLTRIQVWSGSYGIYTPAFLLEEKRDGSIRGSAKTYMSESRSWSKR